MSNVGKSLILLLFSLAAIVLSVGLGTVNISPETIVNIVFYRFGWAPLGEGVPANLVAIVWHIRMPRTLMAFSVGAVMGISGTIMQSLLRNPLASTFTVGVSAGASLTAALFIVMGASIPFLGIFALPATGFLGGLAMVLLVLAMSRKMDQRLGNQTIILVGMVLSLFANGVLTVITALARQYLEQLVFWQMGSFSGSGWAAVGIMGGTAAIGILFAAAFSKELDIMTFGEEQALSMGVDLQKIKVAFMVTAAFLTGAAVSFAGIIGFVDLIAPHVVRKLFGSTHKWALPMSALFGGGFMVLADLAGRTVLSPRELPVGAVTALIGAPFFIYLYSRSRRR